MKEILIFEESRDHGLIPSLIHLARVTLVWCESIGKIKASLFDNKK